MRGADMRMLQRLAHLHGIQTAYMDMAEQRREASAESLLAVLRVLGVPVTGPGDVPEAWRQSRRAQLERRCEPVHVVWGNQSAGIEVRLPDNFRARELGCELSLENEETIDWSVPVDHLPVIRRDRFEGESFVTHKLPLPERLLTGYYRMDLELGGEHHEVLILSAPRKTFSERRKIRKWGLFLPLYALHNDRSWGAGDFGAMRELVQWIADHGGGLVGTLPLLPAFLEAPLEPSPYSPVSRCFWNEFYLDLEHVPELGECARARRLMAAPAFRKRIRALDKADLVDYRRQMALKRQVLEALAEHFFSRNSPRRALFQKFLRPEVEDYARFRATGEARGSDWRVWPQRLREGKLRSGDYDEKAKRYHLYAQWLAHEQMTSLSDESRRLNVKLYLDMPLGVHNHGYDVWREQKLFALDAAGGAPPDPVFTKGQNWGFAPMHPQRLREEHYDYVRRYLRHHLQHAALLRIDHVMGLHRLYWIPRELPASQGAYVSYPADEMYAILSIESHHHEATIAGENLGTVPPVVNRCLKRHDICELFVAQYEFKTDSAQTLRAVPRRSVASLNTHDMHPFQSFWRALDIADRLDLGLLTPKEGKEERRRREILRQALTKFLRRRGWLARGADKGSAIMNALHAYLGASAAEYLLVNLEDLWLETRPQNVPGTTTERPNWRRRARFGLDQMRQSSELNELLAQLEQHRTLKLKGDRR